jgi:hypothetical protein
MEAIIDCIAVHNLAPIGSSVYVAVAARLIAKLTKVDLEYIDAGSSKRRQFVPGKRPVEHR